MNFNMHDMERTITELHAMLQTIELNVANPTTKVLIVQKGKGMKKKGKPMGKGKVKSKT